jgi:hypothetical protein
VRESNHGSEWEKTMKGQLRFAEKREVVETELAKVGLPADTRILGISESKGFVWVDFEIFDEAKVGNIDDILGGLKGKGVTVAKANETVDKVLAANAKIAADNKAKASAKELAAIKEPIPAIVKEPAAKKGK